MTNRIPIVLALAGLMAASPAFAQLIPVKTIPVAETEQFSFFPTAGRSALSMTLADTLLDPFRNPARASLLPRSQYFGAPSFFSVSEGSGGGATFPMGLFMRRGASFGGVVAAFQEIERSTNGFFGGPFVNFAVDPAGETVQPQSGSQHNNYAFALLGHTFGSGRTSIAGSVLWSGLKSIDGVDAFYFGNSGLNQLGDAVDIRLGVTRELGAGRSLEAVALRTRFATSDEIGFTDLVWDPATRQAVPHLRLEHNQARTNVWGAHVEYEQPLDSTWRLGALFTANVVDQPAIPAYDLTAGLGSKGNAVAANLGLGIGRTIGLVSFGLDAIYEPIKSHTWVPDTVDNDFVFHNAKLRGGVSKDFKLLLPGNLVRMHVNAEQHWFNYTMVQRDVLGGFLRSRREQWLERTRGGGISFITPTLQLHYMVQARAGIGRPGVQNGGGIAIPELAIATWMPQPTSPTLGAVNVTRHQFSVSVPVR